MGAWESSSPAVALDGVYRTPGGSEEDTAPAILVGGISLLMPYGLARHLVAVVALPGALAGAIGGLADRGNRRSR
ncbi:hypothetical protein [Arthrobacter sp. NPDC056493]|uniref:hypothetical protein n=1 Tax=Arthrobacter sp. NPDC056493 TaxID=3345839 RepID=UPI00366C50CF